MLQLGGRRSDWNGRTSEEIRVNLGKDLTIGRVVAKSGGQIGNRTSHRILKAPFESDASKGRVAMRDTDARCLEA